MSDSNVISAVTRDRAGKGAARALRRAGRVPAVIYGDKKDPATISLEPRDLRRHLDTGGFFSTVYAVDIDGGGSERVLPRDVQFHPVNGQAMHVDFLRVGAKDVITMHVPLHFIGEDVAPGVKEGGLVSHLMTTVDIACKASDLPEYLEVDISNLNTGESLHLSDIVLPKGVNIPGLAQGEGREPREHVARRSHVHRTLDAQEPDQHPGREHGSQARADHVDAVEIADRPAGGVRLPHGRMDQERERHAHEQRRGKQGREV